MANKKLTELEIWKGALIRAFCLCGMYIFSSAVVMGFTKQLCLAGFIIAGIYFFTEISRLYGFDVKKVLSQMNSPQFTNKRQSFSYLLWI